MKLNNNINKPKTVSKTILKEFPKVTRVTKGLNTYYMVDCRSKTYGMTTQYKRKKENEARELHEKIKAKLINYGVTELHHRHEITTTRMDALNNRLQPFGITIEELVSQYLRKATFEANNALPNVDELVIEWKKYKLNNPLKPLAKATKREVEHYSNWIFMTWGKLNIKELSTEAIENTLGELEVKNLTKKQYWRYISMFLNWCTTKKSINIPNAAKGIEIKVEESKKEIYTMDSLKIMRDLTIEEFNELYPYLLLTAYVGLRPSEAERVNLSHVYFDHNEIYVLPEGKTGSRRPKVEPAVMEKLKQWVSQNPNSPLIPETVTSRNRLFRKSLKARGVTFLQDGLRRTAVTYHYATHKSWDKIVYDFGHDAETSRKYYQRTISESEVKAYWDLVK